MNNYLTRKGTCEISKFLLSFLKDETSTKLKACIWMTAYFFKPLFFTSLGSKEVAFAHAIWSAAVTDAVARACRDGSLTSCGCGKTPRPPDLRSEWRWGGCGDNLQYGYKYVSFLFFKCTFFLE